MTYVEAEFLSWSSVSCQVVSCQVARCIVMLENKACWETVFHFRAFQVGNGSSRPPFLPYLLHFEPGQPRIVDSLLERLAHTFAEL